MSKQQKIHIQAFQQLKFNSFQYRGRRYVIPYKLMKKMKICVGFQQSFIQITSVCPHPWDGSRDP
uniref:Uncharacterized protein n=1 Tax=Oryza nivara TaxID=4536 RepID=A0A0E0I0K2_ORYNI